MKEKVREKSGLSQGFLQGAFILTLSMGLVKVIGALFKIPLNSVIGEYGMGLFNVAYHFYGPVFSLATAGFPIAVARLVSEDSSLGRWRDVSKLKQVAMPFFLIIGLLGMLVITGIAPYYCEQVIGSPNALLPMLALAPATLFACLSSVYRGYYEGLKDMRPTAVSQVVEAIVKLVLGLAGAGLVLAAGQAEYAEHATVFSLAAADADEASFLILAFAAAAAVLGVTVGSGISALYLMLRFRMGGGGVKQSDFNRSPAPRSGRKTLKRLAAMTLPVAAGSITMNVAGLIDATFLQNRIREVLRTAPEALLSCYQGMIPAAYLKNPEMIATFLYGCYTLAFTLYLLVPSLTQAFGTSALPSVTEAWARRDRHMLRDRTGTVLKLTSMLCFPAGLGLSALAEPITAVLYGRDAATPIIVSVLEVLGVASLAAAVCTPLSSMLQAVGRADLPVKLLLVAMGLKIALNYILCAVPEINIMGAALGTAVCYLFLFLAQVVALKKVTGIRFSSCLLFLRPLLCAVVCGLSARAVYTALSFLAQGSRVGEALILGLSVVIGGAIYVICMLILRGIGKNELNLFPQGQKVAKKLEKQGWI